MICLTSSIVWFLVQMLVVWTLLKVIKPLDDYSGLSAQNNLQSNLEKSKKQTLSTIKSQKNLTQTNKTLNIEEDMACKSCAAKNQLMTGRNEKRVVSKEIVPCAYTLEQLVNKLNEATSPFDIAILKSSINFIHRDCNKFKTQLDRIFEENPS